MRPDKDSLISNPSDVPDEFQIIEPVLQTEYLLNGEILQSAGPFHEVYSPVLLHKDGEAQQFLLGHYPLLTEQDSALALEAACRAWDCGRGLWPTMNIEGRIACVENFTHRMIEKKSDVVRLLMWEIGKNHADSEKEFDRTVTYIKDTIEALKELDRHSSRFSMEGGIIAQIRRAPLGVVLCMGPYNYPLNETFTTLIPALIMGNTIIFKPPKYGVLLHKPLLEAFRDCFPPGVVNTVYGEGKAIIPPLMGSGQIDVLAFIGSSRVSDVLKKQHPQPHRLRSVLGLDAKNAGIVLADADIKNAVSECISGAFSFNGQRCTALKILFVHKSIAGDFIKQLSAGTDALKSGQPWEKNVFITPLPEKGKCEAMEAYVQDVLKHGGRICNRYGGKITETLYFPTVLSGVNDKMRLYTEEQFGPVLPIVTYEDINVPLNYVVNSNYGQQISIFGRDPEQIVALIDPLTNQVCRVNINSQCQRGPDVFPFTGRKDSAEGTLSVSDALRVFTIRTLVAAKNQDENRKILTSIVRERKSAFLSTDFVF
jgi:glyceraldehyde-3-phosphate dehydrogenase (NADP+)